MRVFIAAEIPGDKKNEISKLQNELKLTGADVRWVRPESMHITLKFLGEITEEILSGIKDKVAGSLKGLMPFEIFMQSLGVFPKKESPKVLWLGITDGSQELSDLTRRIEEALIPLGFEKEDRPFRPHLTIGRVRTASYLQRLIKKMDELKDSSLGRIPVHRVLIMESHLSSHGAEYECKAEVALKG